MRLFARQHRWTDTRESVCGHCSTSEPPVSAPPPPSPRPGEGNHSILAPRPLPLFALRCSGCRNLRSSLVRIQNYQRIFDNSKVAQNIALSASPTAEGFDFLTLPSDLIQLSFDFIVPVRRSDSRQCHSCSIRDKNMKSGNYSGLLCVYGWGWGVGTLYVCTLCGVCV